MNSSLQINKDPEQSALKLSLWANFVMGVLGIGFFFVTESSAILLDGFFSFISFVIGLIALRVASLIRQAPNEDFQFGFYGFEPLMNVIKGFIIFILCGYAGIAAFDALLEGGRSLHLGPALIYGVVVLVICFGMAMRQKKIAQQTGSTLLDLESTNYLIDGWLTALVFLAFVVAYFLKESSYSYLIPYVDPALTLLMVLLMVGIPLKAIFGNARELLGVSPQRDIQKKVKEIIHTTLGNNGFKEIVPRMHRLGRVIYISIYIISPADYRVEGIKQLDIIRSTLDQAIKDVYPQSVIDIAFTETDKWIQPN